MFNAGVISVLASATMTSGKVGAGAKGIALSVGATTVLNIGTIAVRATAPAGIVGAAGITAAGASNVTNTGKITVSAIGGMAATAVGIVVGTVSGSVFNSGTPGPFLIDNQQTIALPDRRLTIAAVRGYFPALNSKTGEVATDEGFDRVVISRLDLSAWRRTN